MVTETIDATGEVDRSFSEDSHLREFLEGGNEDDTRHIDGITLFRKHCGQRMLKIAEYRHKIRPNGSLNLYPISTSVYCMKCGESRLTWYL